jgi:hypothetical protein
MVAAATTSPRSVADVLGHDVAEVEAPGGPEAVTLLDTVSSLGVPRWGVHQVWHSPAVSSTLRLLSELTGPE